MGLIRRIAVVVLGFIVVFALVWFIALQGSGGDNDAPERTASPAASTGRQTAIVYRSNVAMVLKPAAG